MRSYCYGDDSDSDDDDEVPKAKRTTATCPIAPSPSTTTQIQPHGPTHPTHLSNTPVHSTDPTEHGYDAEHENNGTGGDKQTDGNGHECEGLAYGTETRHPNMGGSNARTTNGTCEHAPQPTPTNTPTPPPPQLPTPARVTPPTSNQQGHVTALNHEQQRPPASNDGHDDNAVTPCLEPHIKYPVRTWCHPPISWSAIGNETAVPNCIEDSRPLFPQPRRRYRKRYPERRPLPTPPTPHTPARFATCLDADSTLAAARAHATSFTTNKSGSENTTHQSNEDHNNNIETAPYSTTCSRPPPWPIKPTPATISSTAIPHPLPQPHTNISPVLSIINSRPPPWPNKYPNQNKYQHNNKYILTRTTTGRRPPPWPNKNGDVPISFTSSHLPHWPNHTIYQPTTSTPPTRPPPWPILPPNTLQNYRNAKRRLRKRS
jgi:hypothetical protein